jgi:cytochrome c-type biogenesis protein CcmH/NrfF
MRPDSTTAHRARGWLPWIVLGVVVVVVVGWVAWPSGAKSESERARSLAAELRCPDCESLSAADSQTQSARAIRRDLRDRVAEDQSDAEIRQVYVDRYGESILLKPEQNGLGLLVWGLPVFFVVLAAGGLVIAFRRWHRAAPMTATEADEELVRSVRASAPDGADPRTEQRADQR